MLVTVISAVELAPTTEDALAVLLVELGSGADELAVTVPVSTVPLVRPVFTFTLMENVAAVPPTMASSVQTTFPVPPCAGNVQVQPAGAVTEKKVVFAGTVITSVALSAALGPLFVTTGVKIKVPPDVTGSGDAASLTLRSALDTTVATSVAVSFEIFSSPPPLTTAVLVTVAGAVCKTFATTLSDG